jgi:hypothetical protein
VRLGVLLATPEPRSAAIVTSVGHMSFMTHLR